MNEKKLDVQGVEVNYYYVCKRKLWLFSQGIQMEQTSDRVLSGKVVHETSYPRQEKREVLVDGFLKLDLVDGEYIREIKLSSKMTEADRMQLLYYLYYLKEMGMEKKGLVNYVKEKKKEEVELTEDDEAKLEQVLVEIRRIKNLDSPPEIKEKSYCTKCAYYEFCYVEEI